MFPISLVRDPSNEGLSRLPKETMVRCDTVIV